MIFFWIGYVMIKARLFPVKSHTPTKNGMTFHLYRGSVNFGKNRLLNLKFIPCGGFDIWLEQPLLFCNGVKMSTQVSADFKWNLWLMLVLFIFFSDALFDRIHDSKVWCSWNILDLFWNFCSFNLFWNI